MTARNLKPFVKGQSGNPGGKPSVPDHLRAIRSLTQNEVTKIVSKYARMNRTELQAAVTSPDTPMLEIAIASIFAQSAKSGDYARLAFLLDRAIGKVPVVEPTDEEAEAFREIRELSTKELISLVREKLPEMEKPE